MGVTSLRRAPKSEQKYRGKKIETRIVILSMSYLYLVATYVYRRDNAGTRGFANGR